VRRAGRLTVVASLSFYIPYYVLGNRDIATYGLFSSVAMGFLAQIPGPARRRSRTLLRSLPIALVLVATGTLLAGDLWAAIAGVLAFGFVIAFGAAGGPSLAAIAPGLQLFFILACFPPYAPQTLPFRLIGVVLGMGLLAVAERVLWPERPPVSYERLLADASDDLADDLQRRAAGGSHKPPGRSGVPDWPVEAVWPPGVPAGARPGSAARHDRALRDAGRALSFAKARLRDLPDGALPPSATEPLRGAAGSAMAAAAALRGGPPPQTDGLRQTIAAVYRRERTEDLGRASITASCLAAAEGAWTLATAVRVAFDASAEPARTFSWLRFPYAGRGAVDLWRSRFAVHLTRRSVYFQGAVRVALALAAARLVAGTLNLSHGFWVLLAALTLLRGRAAETRKTLVPAAVGTVAGAAAVGLLLVVVGPRHDVYAAITPPVMAVAFAAGAIFGLGWGQALFTVLITLVFTQLAPAGLQIAEVRVLDVIVGAAVGVTAGLLAWPRGGSGELRRSSARLLLRSGDVVRDTARALVTTGAPPAGTAPPAGIARVHEAMELVEAAYGAYQVERRRDDAANWPAVLTAGDHAARGADILLDAREPGSLAPWRSVVIDWADRVGDACVTVATAVRDGHAAPPLSTVVGPPPDAQLVDVQAWLAGVTKELALITSRPSDGR